MINAMPIGRIKLLVLSTLILASSFLSRTVHSQTEEIKAKAGVAMTATKEGRYEESYRVWVELLSMGVAGLGEEGYSFARAYAYQAAAMKLAELGDSDCTKTLEWVEKGKRLGPPDYKHVYDVFYPMLIIAEGVCYARQERYEDAYDRLILAKSELRKAPPENAAEFLRNADEYLAAVSNHVISDGDYVTNKGLLQAWIGKVISRSGGTVVVEITYVNGELATGLVKGRRTPFAVSDCKELGAISADALLKGWKGDTQ